MSSEEPGASKLPNDWAAALARHGYDGDVDQLVTGIYASSRKTVYPPQGQVFRAFHLTPLDKVRVVILGQDPYPREGQANGLAFSFDGAASDFPRSLRAIYTNLKSDLGDRFDLPSGGDLTPWTRHGVLLLNATLTVEHGQAGSATHRKLWKEFTDASLRALNKEASHLVFLLWGLPAIRKARSIQIDESRHIVICSTHPAAWTSKTLHPFKDSHPFSAANEFLVKKDLQPVNWQLI